MKTEETVSMEQLAEGTVSSGETSVAAGQNRSGELSADAGQGQRSTAAEWQALGVPQDLAVKHQARKEAESGSGDRTLSAARPDAGEVSRQKADTLRWEELMRDPDLNRKMQETVKARLRPLQQQLDGFRPILREIGARYGMDTSDTAHLDLQALLHAVEQDAPITAAEPSKERSRETASPETAEDRPRQSDRIAAYLAARHMAQLRREAVLLEQRFPGFDLQRELADPRFAALVSPRGGLSVEEAYYALRHRGIERSQAQNLTQAFTRSLRSEDHIPRMNGSDSRGQQPREKTPYSRMSRTERAAYKAKLSQGNVLHR